MAAEPWYWDKAEFVRRLEAAQWNGCLLAEREGIGRSTVSKYRMLHDVEPPAWVRKKGNHRATPSLPPVVEIQDVQLRVEGDFCVSSDWHAPLTNYDTFHRMLDDAQRSGLTRGIIAGDLTNQDALAGHEHKQEGAELEPEMEHLHYSVSTALDVFAHIIITLGNHDRHFAEKARIKFDRSLRMLLADLPKEKLNRLTVTGRDSVIVDTERGPWLVCHTRSYSVLPLVYPNKLALRHGMHIAAGHRHHHAQGKAANGKDIVELGGLQDHERMAYVTRYTNHLPLMQNGYMKLVDGHGDCPMLRS